MGVSYTLIPTCELKGRREAYLEHFKSINAFGFPDGFEVNMNSNWPSLSELAQAAKDGQIKLERNHEELKDNGRIQICYGISHEKSGGYSDLTIEHLNNRIESIHGIKGEFRMLLRLATEMVKSNGPMIIFSAYDACYVDKGEAYEEIWDKVK